MGRMTAPKTYSRTTAEIVELVEAYYAKPGNLAGGNLHIVLDDGNVEDENIEWCRERCLEAGDSDGLLLCTLLAERGRSTRRRICSGG